MLFNSFHFLFFFFVITTLYYSISHSYRWLLLLLASCYFYMVFVPIYILILGFTIVIDYFAGIYLETSDTKKRKIYLIISLIANIGVLAFFKYYNFLNDNLTALLHGVNYKNPIPYLSILLPIGLSFHTFQAMSYTIEVYRGNQKAERHFGIYSLYVMFYPQLVAGPIERPQNILHQFYEKHTVDFNNIYKGLRIMLWGMFKKVVISSFLAVQIVDPVFANPNAYGPLAVLMAIYAYAIQIYADFSGYTDIAIGVALLLGIRFPQNFDSPYIALTLQDFWNRWHMTLSRWLRDYLYIPLGGNRGSKAMMYRNLFLVMIIGGLWHGANWTFVVWGAIHGSYLVAERIVRAKWKGHELGLPPLLVKARQWFLVFNVVCLAWVFFRATSVDAAFTLLGRLFASHGSTAGVSLLLMIVIVASIASQFVPSRFPQKAEVWFATWAPALQIAALAGGLVLVDALGPEGIAPFIYFQF